ncbi:MAG: hypothetical protein KF773_29050 [Deltaproteobacteria bacterium]|nr:hypothetical protein [Deltaproteobacteria bacterium]MCW5801734.1 hypothetical protein [Deltaproteobacteria bacterium]
MRPASAPIYTRVGHTGADELRFCGRRVFAELLGRATAMQMIVCGIVGRVPDPDDMLVVDDIITAMSSADPRLWPFKITRLAAAHGSPAYAMGATLIASHGALFGAPKFEEIARVLVAWQERDAGDDELLAILGRGTPGFGILYGRTDPRFDALVAQAGTRGRASRPYMQLCARAAHVARTVALEPHVFVAIAALCLDLGMTPYQVGVFGMLPLFHDGLANATEGARQAPESLRSLPREDVRYVGRGPRTSPRGERGGVQPPTP